MSVQLEALADDVFGAAAAQARAGARSIRKSFGEIVWNPTYPDLFFLNGVFDLVAPRWRAKDLERALEEVPPDVASFRVEVRDPATIRSLGASLTASGYHHEIRVAMVQVQGPHPDPPPRAEEGIGTTGTIQILPVDREGGWRKFEVSIDAETSEHTWTDAMRDQLIALYRWRLENTPTTFYLALSGDRPVGHVALYQPGPTAYLHGLFTHPLERRRGVGTFLTLAMHDAMRATGAERLTLQCTDDGYLPGFYHRLGFRRVGEQHIWTKSR